METTISLSILNVCGLIFCVHSIFKIINNAIKAARIASGRELPPSDFYNTSKRELYCYQGFITIVNLVLLGLAIFLPFDSTVKLMLYVMISLRVITLWELFRECRKNSW